MTVVPISSRADRGERLRHFQQIPALREVLLVAHDRREVEIRRRAGEGLGREVIGEGGSVELASIGCRPEVDTLYRD